MSEGRAIIHSPSWWAHRRVFHQTHARPHALGYFCCYHHIAASRRLASRQHWSTRTKASAKSRLIMSLSHSVNSSICILIYFLLSNLSAMQRHPAHALTRPHAYQGPAHLLKADPSSSSFLRPLIYRDFTIMLFLNTPR